MNHISKEAGMINVVKVLASLCAALKLFYLIVIQIIIITCF